MNGIAAAAFAAVGHANLALCHHWLQVSVLTFEQAHQLTQAVLLALIERPLAATQALTVGTSVAVAHGPNQVEAVAGPTGGAALGGADLFPLLARGLSGLVAEYANDMAPVAR